MTTATTPTDTDTAINPLFAGAAARLAQFLVDHQNGPAIGSVALDFLGTDDAPRILLHLRGTERRLAEVTSWAGLVEDPAIVVTRRATYIAVSVELAMEDNPLILWVHPRRDEIAALWSQLDHTPEMDESVHISLETLRSATLPAVSDD